MKSLEFGEIKHKYEGNTKAIGVYLVIEEARNKLINDYFFMVLDNDTINNEELHAFCYSRYLKFYLLIDSTDNSGILKDYLLDQIVMNPIVRNSIDYVLMNEIRNSFSVCKRQNYGSLIELRLNSKIDALRNRDFSFIYLIDGRFESIEFNLGSFNTSGSVLDIIATNATENTFSTLTVDETKKVLRDYFCVRNFGIVPLEDCSCDGTKHCEKCINCWNTPFNLVKLNTKSLQMHSPLFTTPIQEP